MTGRYFGGQYDSVKQSAYLEFIKSAKYYQGQIAHQVVQDHYTARLRLDILLGGSVVLSDAMFFDGFFFQTIFLDDYAKNDFILFIRKFMIDSSQTLFEVRQRATSVDDTYLKMFCKKGNDSGFVFSSIPDEYIRTATSVTLKKTQDLPCDFSNWDEFLNKAIEISDENLIKDELRKKIEIFNLMKQIPLNALKKWEPERYDFKSVLNDAKQKNRFFIELTNDPVIDSIIHLIEGEVGKKYPDRSLIQKEINTKTRILVRPPRNIQELKLERIWGQFLQIYNRVIGIQHYCDTFDIGEIEIGDDKVTWNSSDGFSQGILKSLSEISWTEFIEKLNLLGNLRNNWLVEAWNLEKNPNNSYLNARKALDKFIKGIIKEFSGKPSIMQALNIIGGGASIDIDLMEPHGLSLGIGSKLIKIPIETYDFIKQINTYGRDKNNLIEYGKRFMRGI